ncbi:MAG TPA: DUF4349 domain-containing protein [Bacteroidales bacterium]|nr:DUF4349 domain-containing protein [Bacteroidales bacterium]
MKTYLLAIIFLLFISCGSNAYKSSDNYNSEKSISTVATSEAAINEEETTKKSDEQPNEPITITERKLIKEGSISFETDSVDKTKKYIEDKVKFFEGYIAKEYSYDYTEQKQYMLEVRIPSQKFDDFVNSLNTVISSLDNKDIQVKDVTEEYVDVEARIKSKKDVMQRYSELLKHAKSVAEMLDIEREIGTLQADIESLEGRLKYLQNQTSLSTLTLTFYEHRTREFGFWSKIGKSLSGGWNGLLWFFIGVLYLWPLWIILFGGLWLLLRYLKKKKKS